MNLSLSKQIAYCSVMTAFLIVGQLAFSAVAGVEIVTVLLLCFSFCAGVRCAVLSAVSFSLLRCCIWGFSPNTIILYLLYFPLFAFIFAFLGKNEKNSLKNFGIFGVVMLIFSATCACLNIFDLIKISHLYKTTITVFLWILTGLFLLLFIALTFFKEKKLIALVAIASTFTILFTLLDDVITPLVYGWSLGAWQAYFYASFSAMLPQTVCTIISVFLLFYPLEKLFNKIFKKV